MEKKVIWTVDVEPDWGWRTNGNEGMCEGVPMILDVFKEYGVKGIFFLFPHYYDGVRETIENHGHKIGYHPKDNFTSGLDNKPVRFHKFAVILPQHLPYSSPQNHTSLLRHMWYGQPIRDIFYMHPFDIVKPKTKAPSLFCKLWYSQPERAYETFKRLVAKYS